MQHSNPDSVLDAFRAVIPGRAEPPLAGLVTVPLLVPRDDAAVDISLEDVAVPLTNPTNALEWREVDPPHPRRVVVRNTSDTTVDADTGTRLRGGMSSRVVARALSVAAGMVVSVDVEPIGRRWRHEGPLRPVGQASPVVTALLLQSTTGTAWVAAAARMLLRATLSEPAAYDLSAPSTTAADGYVLTAEGHVVASWIRMPITPTRTRTTASRESAGTRGQALIDELARALHRGELQRHVDADDVHRQLVLLPSDSRLVDCVARAV